MPSVCERSFSSPHLCSPEKRDLAAAVWGVVLAKKEPSGPLRGAVEGQEAMGAA